MGKVIPERFHTTSLVSLLAENLNLGIKLARIISGGVLVVLKRSDSQFVVKGQLTHFKLRKFETDARPVTAREGHPTIANLQQGNSVASLEALTNESKSLEYGLLSPDLEAETAIALVSTRAHREPKCRDRYYISGDSVQSWYL